MKKTTFLSLSFLFIVSVSLAWAQDAPERKAIYDPGANAGEEIDKSIKKARAEQKHVLIQVGGNWCGWCLLFHKYIHEDPEIWKFLEDNYVYTLLNYSTENKNSELMARYRNPGRFGYPVFLILDTNGQLIHTQDSGLLEEGKGYNKTKVMNFLRNWTPKALDPANLR